MSTVENAAHAVGDVASVSGTVVRVENIGGNYQYTVAVQTEDNNRPVSAPAVHFKTAEVVEPKAEVKVEEEKPKPVPARKPTNK